MNWHYAINGQQQGPVSADELSRLLSAGSITTETLIWKEGMADWLPLSTAAPEVTAAGVTYAGAGKDVSIQQMREGVAVSSLGSVQFGGFWIRFVAKFIDGILLAIVEFGLNFLMLGSLTATGIEPGSGEVDPAQIGLILGTLAINLGIRIGYMTFMIGKWGATLGKMAVGLKVVTADGGAVSYPRALGRAFAEILSGLILLIGYIIAAFDSEKRSLHDHICSTRVIYKR